MTVQVLVWLEAVGVGAVCDVVSSVFSLFVLVQVVCSKSVLVQGPATKKAKTEEVVSQTTQLVPCLQCARSAVCLKRWVLVQAKQPNLCHVLRLLVQICI